MKKILIILIPIIILIGVVSFIKFKPYTIKDRERLMKIYLEETKPNVIDYIRLDMDKDHTFTLYDVVLVQKKINERRK